METIMNCKDRSLVYQKRWTHGPKTIQSSRIQKQLTVPMEGFSFDASVKSKPPAVFSSACATCAFNQTDQTLKLNHTLSPTHLNTRKNCRHKFSQRIQELTLMRTRSLRGFKSFTSSVSIIPTMSSSCRIRCFTPLNSISVPAYFEYTTSAPVCVQ